MYSTLFWCLLVVLLVFWLYCVATVAPFIKRSEGKSLRSGRVLDQSQQEFRFLTKFKSAAIFFSSSPRRKLLLPLWEIGLKIAS